ncbi:glycosyltransferase family 2 protein [Terrimonas sp. NA20]|uniref:Glycosyltransferase family 2 protein n=1 Tax=Terrimonas ginsenosidimutans TaxID=2908004 RepID=A0ABS9KX14_9BACT|nr:glycosyltransferase family 2 protein [Terrimonas ginsenosidimutans]MCG2616860.1 glycosyltransferase family 2 protein [Terrimonas ginsenosidimutans]
MIFWEIAFFACIFIIFYNYAGYAIIIYFFNLLKKKPQEPDQNADFHPSVSFIVAAFNEEDFIADKIKNSLEQDYPADKIEFIFVTDGSSDKTPEIVKRYPSIRLLHQDLRQGKAAALNRAINIASNDILIISDANTLLNLEASKRISRHYLDPKNGGVAGEKKVMSAADADNGVGEGESLYWKYESWLKKVDDEFYSVVGAAGELFSLRRELYEPLGHDVVLDDFIISLKVVQKGYRVRYEPGAFAMESPSFSIVDERKRKVRIAAGGLQSIVILKGLFRFWRHFRLTFLYISHRVLRWTLTPLCLIFALIANLVIVSNGGGLFYQFALVMQIVFYLMAITASIMEPRKRPGILKIPYYFTFMNTSVIAGFFRFIRGKQSAVWEKAKRQQP